ncbi:MAG: VOC family protein [Proteobacteria bacterium]|nr:VOC family protein [Pseudomonadota bacterium]
MIDIGDEKSGNFCWLDLAAVDSGRARAFYRDVFGWSADERQANGGKYTNLRNSGRNVGSLYQLAPRHLAQQVPSHWTPYIRVDDVDATVRRAAAHGGSVIVQPFDMSGVARIALLTDAVGAQVGLLGPERDGR